jgi:hypothetical protein
MRSITGSARAILRPLRAIGSLTSSRFLASGKQSAAVIHRERLWMFTGVTRVSRSR